MKVPVDYFGVSGNASIQGLLNMSSNKRARRVALNNLIRLAKASNLLARNSTVKFLGLVVDESGEQFLVFQEGMPTGCGEPIP